jgi:methylmalonyl-CoA mutase N-terminal domain/subunit
MRERFQAVDPRSLMLRFHTQTAGSSLTAQQPEINIVRTTIQALAAVLGGTQSLHTNAMDEALALPTEQAARIALRTQQIIAHESGVTDTADPLAGSYAIEELTTGSKTAGEYIERIDGLGGMLRAIEIGYGNERFRRLLINTSARLKPGGDCRRRKSFSNRRGIVIPTLRVDPRIEQEQIDRAGGAERAPSLPVHLNALEEGARGSQNLLPRILDCVEAEVTVGEISGCLRRVWGEYREAVTV